MSRSNKTPSRSKSKPRKESPEYRRNWNDLRPEGQRLRDVDLWIVDKVRRKKMSLKEAARQQGVTPESVIKNTNAFKKVGSRWVAKKYDRISVSRDIFVKGKRITIVTNDSRQRSKIGRYFSAVSQFWDKGKEEPLLKLAGLTVKDSRGQTYMLDTNPESVIEILSLMEGPEYGEPYDI